MNSRSTTWKLEATWLSTTLTFTPLPSPSLHKGCTTSCLSLNVGIIWYRYIINVTHMDTGQHVDRDGSAAEPFDLIYTTPHPPSYPSMPDFYDSTNKYCQRECNMFDWFCLSPCTATPCWQSTGISSLPAPVLHTNCTEAVTVHAFRETAAVCFKRARDGYVNYIEMLWSPQSHFKISYYIKDEGRYFHSMLIILLLPKAKPLDVYFKWE